jgi:hypothetical protein
MHTHTHTHTAHTNKNNTQVNTGACTYKQKQHAGKHRHLQTNTLLHTHMLASASFWNILAIWGHGQQNETQPNDGGYYGGKRHIMDLLRFPLSRLLVRCACTFHVRTRACRTCLLRVVSNFRMVLQKAQGGQTVLNQNF